jgi:cell division protein FtsW
MRGRLPIDRTFLILLGILVAFGLLMLLSASGPLGFQKFGDSAYYLKNQLVRGVFPGMVAFFVLSFLDYRAFRPLAVGALVASVVLLLLVYVPGLGLAFGGSGRWVSLGPIAFQPSEFVKVTFLIYVAAWLANRQEQRAKSVSEGLVPFLLALGVVMFLLIKQPNTGSMSVLAGSALLTYFIAGAPVSWFLGLGGGMMGLIWLLVRTSEYRAARFMTFLHPELDPMGKGYQINQALLAVGSGGPFGLGYGHSRQKYLYLPEVAGDSIFAVMAEEMGFFLTAGFLALFAAFVWRCLAIARAAPDAFGKFLVTGFACWFAIQAVFNVFSMLGLMPITGVTLPFVSHGSSAFVALAVACGMIASVSRQARLA